MDDLRLKVMARHTPLIVNMQQSRNGQWRASIWLTNAEDADFWHRFFEAVMEEAKKEATNASQGS